MGLFSSIKKGLSKAWSGVKKAVKGVARTVKKVAKKVAYATPWGKKLWDFGSKVGKGIMKGIGKIAGKLGPVGMMALSFVLAPVIGPMVGNLWSGFGAGAAAMATSANAFVATLGNIGSGIFAAGNFVGGTLGALGNAVSQGASNIMSGNFSGAVSSFASNMSSALTGEAGMAAVNAGAAQAAAQSGSLLGQGVDATTAVQQGVDAQWASENLGSNALEATADIPLGISEQTTFTADKFAEQAASQFTAKPLESVAQEAITGKTTALTLAETDAFVQYGAEGVKAIQPAAMNAGSSFGEDVNKARQNYEQVKSLLGGKEQQGGFQPYVPQISKARAIGSASGASGQGSSGFSLLGGVEGLEESLRNSQRLMFS